MGPTIIADSSFVDILVKLKQAGENYVVFALAKHLPTGGVNNANSTVTSVQSVDDLHTMGVLASVDYLLPDSTNNSNSNSNNNNNTTTSTSSSTSYIPGVATLSVQQSHSITEVLLTGLQRVSITGLAKASSTTPSAVNTNSGVDGATHYYLRVSIKEVKVLDDLLDQSNHQSINQSINPSNQIKSNQN